MFNRILVYVFCIAITGMLLSNTAFAQLSNRKTTITFGGPIEVPGVGVQVLPAGTYVFKLLNSFTDRNVVQILDKDESKVLTTILAIPNFRLKTTDKTVLTFDERPAGQPPALRAWFYPGEKWGQEFVYSKAKATQLAKATNVAVPYVPDTPAPANTAAVTPAAQPSAASLEKLPLMAVQPSGQDVQIAQVIEAPPATSARLQSEGPIRNASLPKTGSNLPLAALIGLLCLGVGVTLRSICVR